MLIVSAQEMRMADQRAMNEFSIPGILLMENAALGAARLARDLLGLGPEQPLYGIKVVALCGNGNNGGDAIACARILANQGAQATVLLLGDPHKLSPDTALNWKIAAKCGLALKEAPASLEDLRPDMNGCHLILDGLLGTGFTPPARDRQREAIEFINSYSGLIPILSMDMPSGQCADTGVAQVAIKADAVATFAAMKRGLALNPGRARIEIIDIGLPQAALDHVPDNTWLLTSDMVRDIIPKRPPGGHKGSFGHVYLLGASLGKTGALTLAAMGAQASGAGLITMALPHSLQNIVAARLSAPMSLGLPQTSQQGLSLDALDIILKQKASAWVIGPGLGTEEESRQLARVFLKNNRLPVVVDADALNALAPLSKDQIASPEALLTPHPGEAARLLDCTVEDVQSSRISAAHAIASLSGAVCLLKGAASVLAAPGGQVLINHSGNDLLASGGSGDVLAGLAGGLLAQGIPVWQAATIACHVHGLAADLARAEGIMRGWPIEQLPLYITKAWQALC